MGRLLHDISHNSSNLLLPTLAPSVLPINLDPAPPGGRVQNFVLDQMAPNMPAELLPELSWLDDYKKEHDGAAVASLARAWKNKDRLHPTAPTLESESKMSKKKLQQRARADKLYAKNPSYSAKDDELLGP